MVKFSNKCVFVFVGDEELSGPSWAAEDDDDPENRYGSKSPDIKFVKHPSCKREDATPGHNFCTKSGNPQVIRAQLRPINERPRRSCRAQNIKYTF